MARDAAEARAFDGVPAAQRNLVLSLLALVAERDLAVDSAGTAAPEIGADRS